MYLTENDHGPPYQPDEVEANDSKHKKGINLHYSQKHMFSYTFNCGVRFKEEVDLKAHKKDHHSSNSEPTVKEGNKHETVGGDTEVEDNDSAQQTVSAIGSSDAKNDTPKRCQELIMTSR